MLDSRVVSFQRDNSTSTVAMPRARRCAVTCGSVPAPRIANGWPNVAAAPSRNAACKRADRVGTDRVDEHANHLAARAQHAQRLVSGAKRLR